MKVKNFEIIKYVRNVIRCYEIRDKNEFRISYNYEINNISTNINAHEYPNIRNYYIFCTN